MHGDVGPGTRGTGEDPQDPAPTAEQHVVQRLRGRQRRLDDRGALLVHGVGVDERVQQRVQVRQRLIPVAQHGVHRGAAGEAVPAQSAGEAQPVRERALQQVPVRRVGDIQHVQRVEPQQV